MVCISWWHGRSGLLVRFLQSAMFKKEKQLVKNVAEFLVLHQIPSFVSTVNIYIYTRIRGMRFVGTRYIHLLAL